MDPSVTSLVDLSSLNVEAPQSREVEGESLRHRSHATAFRDADIIDARPPSPAALPMWAVPTTAESPLRLARAQADDIERLSGQYQSPNVHLVELLLTRTPRIPDGMAPRGFGVVTTHRLRLALHPPPLRPSGFMLDLVKQIRAWEEVKKDRKERVAEARRAIRQRLRVLWLQARNILDHVSWGPAPPLRWTSSWHAAARAEDAAAEESALVARPEHVVEALRLASSVQRTVVSSTYALERGARREPAGLADADALVAKIPDHGFDIGLRGPMWKDMLYQDWSHTKPLATLDFRGFGYYLTDFLIVRLLSQPAVLPNLRFLAVADCRRVTSRTLLNLLRRAPSLTGLDVTQCRGLSSRFFAGLLADDDAEEAALAAGTQARRSASVVAEALGKAKTASVPTATTPSTTPKYRLRRQLQTLKCGGCVGVTHDFVLLLAQRGMALTSLHLPGTDAFRDDVCDALASRPPGYGVLTDLNIARCERFSDEGLLALTSHVPSLTTLNVSGCRQLSPIAFAGFPKPHVSQERVLVRVRDGKVVAAGDEAYEKARQLRVAAATDGDTIEDGAGNDEGGGSGDEKEVDDGGVDAGVRAAGLGQGRGRGGGAAAKSERGAARGPVAEATTGGGGLARGTSSLGGARIASGAATSTSAATTVSASAVRTPVRASSTSRAGAAVRVRGGSGTPAAPSTPAPTRAQGASSALPASTRSQSLPRGRTTATPATTGTTASSSATATATATAGAGSSAGSRGAPLSPDNLGRVGPDGKPMQGQMLRLPGNEGVEAIRDNMKRNRRDSVSSVVLLGYRDMETAARRFARTQDDAAQVEGQRRLEAAGVARAGDVHGEGGDGGGAGEIDLDAVPTPRSVGSDAMEEEEGVGGKGDEGEDEGENEEAMVAGGGRGRGGRGRRRGRGIRGEDGPVEGRVRPEPEHRLEWRPRVVFKSQLVSIDVSATRVNDAALKLLSEACGLLRHLTMARCPRVSGDGLAHIATGCTRLVSLDLTDCAQISDLALRQFADACTPPEAARDKATFVSQAALMPSASLDDWLRSVAMACPVHTLKLAGCHQVSDAGLAIVARRFGNSLTDLDLGGCYRLTDATMESLAAHGHGLRTLRLGGRLNLESTRMPRPKTPPEGTAGGGGGASILTSKLVMVVPRYVDANGDPIWSDDDSIDEDEGEDESEGESAEENPGVPSASSTGSAPRRASPTRTGPKKSKARLHRERHKQRTFFGMPRVTGRGLRHLFDSLALRASLQTLDLANLVQLKDEDVIAMFRIPRRILRQERAAHISADEIGAVGTLSSSSPSSSSSVAARVRGAPGTSGTMWTPDVRSGASLGLAASRGTSTSAAVTRAGSSASSPSPAREHMVLGSFVASSSHPLGDGEVENRSPSRGVHRQWAHVLDSAMEEDPGLVARGYFDRPDEDLESIDSEVTALSEPEDDGKEVREPLGLRHLNLKGWRVSDRGLLHLARWLGVQCALHLHPDEDDGAARDAKDEHGDSAAARGVNASATTAAPRRPASQDPARGYSGKVIRLGPAEEGPAILPPKTDHLPGLRSFVIARCDDVTDVGVAALARVSPYLEHLVLDLCHRVTSRAMTLIARRCPLIRHVSVVGVTGMGDAGVDAFAQSSFFLERLAVEDCASVSQGALLEAASLLPRVWMGMQTSLDFDAAADADTPAATAFARRASVILDRLHSAEQDAERRARGEPGRRRGVRWGDEQSDADGDEDEDEDEEDGEDGDGEASSRGLGDDNDPDEDEEERRRFLAMEDDVTGNLVFRKRDPVDQLFRPAPATGAPRGRDDAPRGAQSAAPKLKKRRPKPAGGGRRGSMDVAAASPREIEASTDGGESEGKHSGRGTRITMEEDDVAPASSLTSLTDAGASVLTDPSTASALQLHAASPSRLSPAALRGSGARSVASHATRGTTATKSVATKSVAASSTMAAGRRPLGPDPIAQSIAKFKDWTEQQSLRRGKSLSGVSMARAWNRERRQMAADKDALLVDPSGAQFASPDTLLARSASVDPRRGRGSTRATPALHRVDERPGSEGDEHDGEGHAHPERTPTRLSSSASSARASARAGLSHTLPASMAGGGRAAPAEPLRTPVRATHQLALDDSSIRSVKSPGSAARLPPLAHRPRRAWEESAAADPLDTPTHRSRSLPKLRLTRAAPGDSDPPPTDEAQALSSERASAARAEEVESASAEEGKEGKEEVDESSPQDRNRDAGSGAPDSRALVPDGPSPFSAPPVRPADLTDEELLALVPATKGGPRTVFGPGSQELMIVTVEKGLRPALPMVMECIRRRALETHSAFVLQRSLRQYRIRCMKARALRTVAVARHERMFKAALGVQKLWRAFAARRELRRRRVAKVMEITKPRMRALKLIQRVERGRQARNFVRLVRRARKLQVFHWFRRLIHVTNWARQQRPFHAATSIQRVWRGHKGRQRAHRRRAAGERVQRALRAAFFWCRAAPFRARMRARLAQKDQVVLWCQSHWRGFKYGRAVAAARRAERNAAATTIQRAFRWHQVAATGRRSRARLTHACTLLAAAFRGQRSRQRYTAKWVHLWYLHTPPLFYEQRQYQRRCVFARPFVDRVLARRHDVAVHVRLILRAYRVYRFRSLLKRRGFDRLLLRRRQRLAAMKIQRAYRAFRDHSIVREARRRVSAVRAIQALIRGFLARRRLRRSLRERRDVETRARVEREETATGWYQWYLATRRHGAALVVQRWWSRIIGPHLSLWRWKRRKEKAARVIQRATRAWMWRRWYKWVQGRRKAAVQRIEAWWRSVQSQRRWALLMRHRAVLRFHKALRERAVFRVSARLEELVAREEAREAETARKLQYKFRQRRVIRRGAEQRERKRLYEALTRPTDRRTLVLAAEARELSNPFVAARVFLPITRNGLLLKVNKRHNLDLVALIRAQDSSVDGDDEALRAAMGEPTKGSVDRVMSLLRGPGQRSGGASSGGEGGAAGGAGGAGAAGGGGRRASRVRGKDAAEAARARSSSPARAPRVAGGGTASAASAAAAAATSAVTPVKSRAADGSAGSGGGAAAAAASPAAAAAAAAGSSSSPASSPGSVAHAGGAGEPEASVVGSTASPPESDAGFSKAGASEFSTLEAVAKRTMDAAQQWMQRRHQMADCVAEAESRAIQIYAKDVREKTAKRNAKVGALRRDGTSEARAELVRLFRDEVKDKLERDWMGGHKPGGLDLALGRETRLRQIEMGLALREDELRKKVRGLPGRYGIAGWEYNRGYAERPDGGPLTDADVATRERMAQRDRERAITSFFHDRMLHERRRLHQEHKHMEGVHTAMLVEIEDLDRGLTRFRASADALSGDLAVLENRHNRLTTRQEVLQRTLATLKRQARAACKAEGGVIERGVLLALVAQASAVFDVDESRDFEAGGGGSDSASVGGR